MDAEHRIARVARQQESIRLSKRATSSCCGSLRRGSGNERGVGFETGEGRVGVADLGEAVEAVVFVGCGAVAEICGPSVYGVHLGPARAPLPAGPAAGRLSSCTRCMPP